MIYKIYCDGAVSNNGYENAIGGWAYVILDDKDTVLFEENNFEKYATNNRMELYSCYKGLDKLLTEITLEEEDKVEVYTDSAYLHNCYSQKWYLSWLRNNWLNSKKQPVANKSLWQLIIPFFENEKVDFFKVKGHNNNYWNEYVDSLAVAAKKNGGD